MAEMQECALCGTMLRPGWLARELHLNWHAETATPPGETPGTDDES